MPLDIIPPTRLEAVNRMLRCISQTGVLTLDPVDMNADSENAVETLSQVLREVLMEGWHFNIEKGFELLPSDALGQVGHIVLPSNTLKIDTTQRSMQKDLVWRGGKLYDRVRHTFDIGEPVTVDLVVALPFEDITPTARAYVTIKAARRFAGDQMSSSSLKRLTEDDEARARIAMEQEETENDDRTMAQASPHVARMRRGQRGAG